MRLLFIFTIFFLFSCNKNKTDSSFLSQLKSSYNSDKAILVRFITEEQIEQELAKAEKEGNGFEEFYGDWEYYQEEYFIKKIPKEELMIYSIDLKKATEIFTNKIFIEEFSTLLLKKGKGIFCFKNPILEPHYYIPMAYFFNGGNLSFQEIKENTKITKNDSLIQSVLEDIKKSKISLKNLQ